jgi:putative iron-dependent peroxidase
MNAQHGIYALGTPEHCFVELSLAEGADPVELVRAAAGLTGPLSTIGGVNVVVGFRPQLWAQVAPDDAPADVHGFEEDIVGPDGFTMPATQHDGFLWIAGGSRTSVFDTSREALRCLGGTARPASEVTGWVYRHDRDLTGFIDGTENPSLLEAAEAVAVPEGKAGAGSSVLLYQLWPHDTPAWSSLSEDEQEKVIGRTKPDSIELSEKDMPDDSHVSRTVLEVNGEELDIFRRNVAYGGVTDHGTVFVGFSWEQFRLHQMLLRMAGLVDGPRDALTRYTRPVSGAYYTIPSIEALARFAPEDEDG